MILTPASHTTSTNLNTTDSPKRSTDLPKRLDLMRVRGQFHWPSSISNTSSIEYCRRHVSRFMFKAGLSSRKTWPEYAESDERAQEAFREGFKKDGRSGRRLHNHSDRPDAPRDHDRSCPHMVLRRRAPDTAGVGRAGESQTAGR